MTVINCKQNAYLGWTKETHEISEMVSLMFPQHKDEKLYVGKKVLATQNREWKVEFFHDESMEIKLNALKESGIGLKFNTLVSNARKFNNIF